jgi:hypothetical protein
VAIIASTRTSTEGRVKKTMWFRSVPVLVLFVLVGLGATAAFAAAPTDQGAFPLNSVPDCVAGAPDTGGAHICKVHPFASGPWQASTGEWILVRGAIWAVGGGADEALCLAIQSSLDVTITIDGNSLPVDNIPCAFDAADGIWVSDWRALSPPLPPGDHQIVQTLVFTTAIPALGISAGSTSTPSATLTVVPNG